MDELFFSFQLASGMDQRDADLATLFLFVRLFFFVFKQKMDRFFGGRSRNGTGTARAQKKRNRGIPDYPRRMRVQVDEVTSLRVVKVNEAAALDRGGHR